LKAALSLPPPSIGVVAHFFTLASLLVGAVVVGFVALLALDAEVVGLVVVLAVESATGFVV
jgi:hypothetical protein